MSDQLIILDNIIFDLQKKGGISVYWLELIKRFHASKEDVTMLGCIPTFDTGLVRNNPPGTLIPKFISTQLSRYLPVRLRKPTTSLFHSSYYRVVPHTCNTLNVVTVYDFMYERFRKGLPKVVHSWQKRYAIRWADGVIFISESTKRDLLFFFPEFEDKNIEVIHLGVSSEFRPIDILSVFDEVSYVTAHKYVIFVGDRRGYKNFQIAVDTVGEIADCHFLIIGGGHLSSSEIAKLDEKLDGRYWHFQDVGNDLLNYFYNGAFCLLYSSAYEGFGMPVLEAMSAGCPVVAVNSSSIPEVCGRAGLLASKACVPDFVDKISLLDKPEFREKTIAKGYRQARKFSWDRCFKQTLDFYKKIHSMRMNIR